MCMVNSNKAANPLAIVRWAPDVGLSNLYASAVNVEVRRYRSASLSQGAQELRRLLLAGEPAGDGDATKNNCKGSEKVCGEEHAPRVQKGVMQGCNLAFPEEAPELVRARRRAARTRETASEVATRRNAAPTTAVAASPIPLGWIEPLPKEAPTSVGNNRASKVVSNHSETPQPAISTSSTPEAVTAGPTKEQRVRRHRYKKWRSGILRRRESSVGTPSVQRTAPCTPLRNQVCATPRTDCKRRRIYGKSPDPWGLFLGSGLGPTPAKQVRTRTRAKISS